MASADQPASETECSDDVLDAVTLSRPQVTLAANFLHTLSLLDHYANNSQPHSPTIPAEFPP